MSGPGPTFPFGAVGYQVYVRSFADADGDGVGDLAGVVDRLPYLAALGVDALWLSPVQPSPQVDHGYDVADYTDIDPLFGDLAVFDRLLARAHGLGMRLLIDLVPNHCSDRHPLFVRAVAAGPGAPERALFHFAPGSGPGGAAPPNNWTSVFGGPAWTRVDREWYLHLYTPHQPDWNWRHPDVAAFFEGVLRFWLDRGVDGFRVDVAHGLAKTAGYPPLPSAVAAMDGLRSNEHVCDLEEVHDIYRSWRRLLDAYEPPRSLLGEVNLPADRSWRYTRPDELDQVFTFPLWRLGWEPASWRAALEAAQSVTERTGRPAAWTVENHDIPRLSDRFGGGALGRRRSLALTIFLMGLPGSTYLYQGQELALPQGSVPAAARVDPAAPGGRPLGRDGARIPLPWAATGPSLGFNATGASWLPQPPEWGTLSVEAQEGDPGAALPTVGRAVARRRDIVAAHPGWARSTARFETAGGALLAHTAELTSVVTMGSAGFPCPAERLVVSTAPLTPEGLLPPDAAAWWTSSPSVRRRAAR